MATLNASASQGFLTGIGSRAAKDGTLGISWTKAMELPAPRFADAAYRK
jgi:hypothetical protein